MISGGRSDLHCARASDLPTTIRCTDASDIGSSGALVFCRTHPIQRFFEFFLRVLLCMTFLLHPWDLEMFTLTKPLVLLIALSYDHQNHSKWYKWCHVLYSIILSKQLAGQIKIGNEESINTTKILLRTLHSKF